MSFEMKININGQTKAAARMKRIVSGINDFRPVWKKISNDFFKIETKLFSSQGSSGKHGKWKALSPAYAKRKPKGLGILHLTGEFEDSLTSGNHFTINEISNPSFMRVGTSNKLGVIHTEGLGRMPKRRAIDLTKNNTEGWFALIQRWGSKIVNRK